MNGRGDPGEDGADGPDARKESLTQADATPPAALAIQAIFPAHVVDSGSGTWATFSRLRPHWAALGISVEVISEPDPSAAADNPGALATAVVSRWREDPPGIIHCELPSGLGAALQGPAQAHGLAVSASFHHIFVPAPRQFAAHVLGELLTFHQGCDLSVAESQSSLVLAAAIGLRQITLIRRGVGAWCASGRRQTALRARWGVADDEPVVLWVGRLVQAKDPHALIRIWSQVQAGIPSARLVIVGAGPEQLTLQEALPQAHFLPWQDETNLADIYASAELLLHTAPSEPAGNVLLEAAAAGLPIVGRSGANLSEVLLPQAAAIHALDEAGLAAAVLRVLSEPALRRNLGAAARACAAVWSESATAAAWAGQWRTLAAAKRKRGDTSQP